MARVTTPPAALLGDYVAAQSPGGSAVVGYRVSSCPDCRTPLARHEWIESGYNMTIVSDRLVPLADGSFGRSRASGQADEFTRQRTPPFDVHCPTRSCSFRRIRVDIPPSDAVR